MTTERLVEKWWEAWAEYRGGKTEEFKVGVWGEKGGREGIRRR
jgi:hypothetical protein